MFEVVENGKKLNLIALSGFDDCIEIKAEKKDYLSNLDCYALRYAFLYFAEKNPDYFGGFENLDDMNAIQDKELYLGNFEGFPISESETLETIYLTEEGRIVASVYNKETDSFSDYLID